MDTRDESTLGRVLVYLLIAAGIVIAVQVLIHALPLLVTIGVIFGPPVWVYLDAERRGVERAPLWALLALLGNVVGLVIYLLLRPTGSRPPCARCGAALHPEWSICPHCGHESRPPTLCPACGEQVKEGWRFCPRCRTRLDPSGESASGTATD